MSTERDSFLLYRSFYGPIKKMTNNQLGRLFRAIFEYQISGESARDTDIEMALGFFINQFKIDEDKYQERCAKNRDNIMKRWSNIHNDTNEYERIRSVPIMIMTMIMI